MKSKANELSPAAYVFDGKLPLRQAIPLGLQHVLAMFVASEIVENMQEFR